ncbi:MAG TPA: ATP-binding protein [Anaerolineales bacterium]|nr:ATP-binding protein [Anaerolineales bacterium]
MIGTPTFDKMALLRLAFKGLEDNELQEMATLTEIRTYPPDHILCREGAYEEVFYIIADGKVEITKKLIEGEDERLLRLSGRGDMVGEMALIQNAPRAATVRTLTECTVLEMEKRDFEIILSRSPRMAIDIIRITLDRIRTNDQKMINELQQTNKVLRQLDRNKLEFIQVAAHELRTPLTVLKGYVKMLTTFPAITENATLGNVTAGILKGADRMHEIVNLMLDVTRIDKDTLKLVLAPVPLKRLINDLVHEFEETVDRPILIATQHAEERLTLNGDPTLIYKALYQLLINAIKYTPDGGRVRITTRPVVMAHNVPGVEIAVRDTGIGLDAEHHELVFEKFYQVGSVDLHSSGKTTFKGGGPGLGLAIVRGVARAHGGKTWVESAGHDEVNYTGSTFYLQLPVNPPV